MSKKQLNAGRAKLGMAPVKDQAWYAPATSHNMLMYSPTVGETDPDWPYPWSCGGYCFNDVLDYEQSTLDSIVSFIKQDNRPTLYFSFGSINGPRHGELTEWVYELSRKKNFKLIVGSGWWKVGENLEKSDNLYVLDKVIPHYLIFPLCSALVIHGGSGTTHSACRSGRPVAVIPHVLDQYYWGYRTKQLGCGPGNIDIKSIKRDTFEATIMDLLTNESYKKAAAEVGAKVQAERGLDSAVDYIEKVLGAQ
jgi:UDP:flavonoid glycosyltransferase YjiC (YdhE family)